LNLETAFDRRFSWFVESRCGSWARVNNRAFSGRRADGVSFAAAASKSDT
jgi:hypothetical protein